MKKCKIFRQSFFLTFIAFALLIGGVATVLAEDGSGDIQAPYVLRVVTTNEACKYYKIGDTLNIDVVCNDYVKEITFHFFF